MAESCRIFAPAKINIGLRVFPGAKGGYHSIEGVFQAVSLYDTLFVERRGGPGECAVSCGACLPKDNTLTAAYAGFCAETGIRRGVHVELKKRIPAGAGLGGGSSDAAALVFALERLFSVPADAALRARIAGRVGCDVFFFLLGAGCAVVAGCGEKVRPIAPRKDLTFVLVFPGESVSTRRAYALLDKSFAAGYAPQAPAFSELEPLYYGPVQSWRFCNSFTAPVSAEAPCIARALGDVRAAGAVFADMSGSGSAVFGVFASRAKARSAFLHLVKRWEWCFLVN